MPEIGDHKKKKVSKKKVMNREDMALLMQEIIHNVEGARESGQDEYAREEKNAFANFERVAEYLNINRKEVLMVYLLKHIDGITSYIKGQISQREDVTGRITDAITYLCLLWGMVESEREDE